MVGGKIFLILTSVYLKVFTDCLSKTAVRLLFQACTKENRDLYARWLKPWDFVADDGREVIGICIVVEATIGALLGKITHYSGL